MINLDAISPRICLILVILALVRLTATDPISQLNCHFDSPKSYCNWNSNSVPASNWRWTQSSARTVNFTGPLQPVDKKGYFILSYNRTNGNSNQPTATLQSPVIDAFRNQTCFQFNYFTYGVGVKRLVLNNINISTNEETEVWSRHASSGDMWHLTHIHVPAHNFQFKLKFSAYAGMGAIALDNFKGIPYQCPNDGVCDFESGICDWTPINATNYKFNLIMAKDESDQGVMFDHTTQTEYGHLLQARNGVLNDRAVIVKETPSMYTTHCLTFWYYRQKSYKNKLEVLLFGSDDKNISIWSSSLTFPLQTWHRAMVTISPDQYGYFQRIGIAATHLDPAPIYSPINMDDISLQLGRCPQPITCDFNVDMCGFMHNFMSGGQSAIWPWNHGFGRVEYGSQLNFQYPPEDRSGYPDGMFLYTDFTALHTSNPVRNMRIDSEYVSATTASCLTFYYLSMDTTSVSFVVSTFDKSEVSKVNLWTYNRTEDPNTNNQRKSWIPVNIDIERAFEFKVLFEVTTNVSNTYIALDDISYILGNCSSAGSSTTTSPIQSSTIAVPHQQQVSCDFESGDFCGWREGLDTKWSINQLNGRQYSSLKPSADHTLRNRNGRYAYIEHSSDDSVTEKEAVLTVIDTYVNQTNFIGQSCFSLWFYMRADSSAQLKIDSYNEGSNKSVTESVLRNNDWGEKWNLLRFETYQDVNYDEFNITAHVKNAFVAIDDIKLSHKPCSMVHTEAFQCNFEEQRYYSCGFGAPTGWVSLWKLVAGSVLSQQVSDHTFRTLNGHMMALDSKSDGLIASQWFAPTHGSCLTFSYLMTGLNNNETLEFGIIKDNVISTSQMAMWSVTGNSGNNWYTHRLTITSDLRWRMTFSGRFNNSPGIIAIDDINIDYDKSCPPQGKCDFESGDTCLWENQKPTKANSFSKGEKLRSAQLLVGSTANSAILQQSDFTWTVHSPSLAYFTQYPPSDHTIGEPNGYYLLLKADASRLEGQRSILMSDRYDIDPNDRTLCLSFYYYFKSNGGTTALTQLDVYQSEYFSSVTKIAKISSPVKSIDSWIHFNVTVRPLTANSTNIWFYLVGTIITIERNDPFSYVYASSLAIDDISITSGQCLSGNDMFVCSPIQKISKSKVCDKVKDCSNGHDEKVCGSCDFEDSFLCDYGINWIRDNLTNKSVYKWRFGDSSSGPKSGADHTNGYMISRRLGPANNLAISQSDLITPVMSGAAASCYVSFAYNIKRDPHFSAPNSTLTVILSSQNGFEETEIWNSDAIGPSDGWWLSGSAYLKRMTSIFTLIFRARDTGLTPDSYVAIDNIVFKDCEPAQIIPRQCDSLSEYQCSNGRCISKYYVCDYSDNCGDNSDEKMCSDYLYRNDFESGWHIWMHEQAGWLIRSGYHTLTEGETRDHTTGTGLGHFAYLSSEASGQAKTVNLVGPYIPQRKDCRITMWADIKGIASLTVKVLNTHTRTMRVVSGYTTTNSFAYERLITMLDKNDYNGILYRVYLEATLRNDDRQQTSYIAIDDISLSPECQTSATVPTGPTPTAHPTPNPCPPNKPYDCKNSDDPTKRVCIPMDRVCDFTVECPNNNDERDCGSCSFDKNNLCGWHNTGDSVQKWSLQSANHFINNPFIPNSDSTGNKTGSFIIIDTSKGGTYNTDAIMTTPPLGATAANCKLIFWYHHWYPAIMIQRDPPILTIKVTDGKGIQKTIREIRQRVKTWTKATIHIGSMAAGFQVSITAKGQVSAQTQPFADIEIDSIKFFQCENIDLNWDTSLSCSFESGTCGWTDLDILTASKLDWVREKSSDIDPGYDHTSRIRPLPQQYGTWIRTRKELGMTGNNSATLITIQNIESPITYCLTFWYHMWGSNLAQFALLSNEYKSDYGGQVLWLKKNPQSNNWIKESVTVQSNFPYYLMFKASLQSPNGRHEDSIGLDDITWSEGQCPNQPLCDFETNLCGWISGDQLWQRTVPARSTDKSLRPLVDHTLGLESGTYLRLTTVNQNQASLLTYTFNDSTPLDDSTPFPQNSMCLKFWYYRSTPFPYNNTLDIEISTNHSQNVDIYTVWTINQFPEWGTYNDQWLYARVNLTLVNKDMIRFKGQLKDSQSVIAIDDILLQSHPCEPIGWCDFESDFCGWNNLVGLPKDILWLRNSGSSTSTLNGPKADHTSRTLEGWYAFVPSDSQQSGTAMLISEPLTYQVLCLKFYYQITSDSKIVAPKLQVLFRTPNQITQVLANISSTTQNQWIPFNITHEFDNAVRYRLILKTLEGNITECDVAVDDIQVWEDTCADVDANSRLVSTQTPISTQIPAIEKAFDCDFESKGCNWNTSISNVWTVTHWTEGVSQIGPQVDHTLRTSKGHYLLFDSSKLNQNVGQPVLPYSLIQSNTMAFTDSPNCLSFWYYSDSESYFNISVSYALQSSSQSIPDPLGNTLLVVPTVTSSSWKQLRTELPIIPNISIAIAVVFHNKMVGALALDDILLNPGKCQLTGQMCDFSYNYCGFKVDRLLPNNGNKIGFMANEAILKNYKLKGPEWDHTTKSIGNYFLFTNQDTDPDTFYRTDLIIPNLSPTLYQARCLKFWYQKTGQTTNLKIFVIPINDYNNYGAKWTVNSDTHTHWTMGQLTIRAQYPHKIIFSMSKSRDMSYIALDDISISDGVCDPPVSCDFDIDWCDWYFLDGFNDTNWKWGRFANPPDVNWPGPRYDHTLNKPGGFLYMSAYRDLLTAKITRNAYIESMPVSANQSNCFSFYLQTGGSDFSLQISVVEFIKASQTNRTQILRTISKSTDKWTKFNIKLDPTMLSTAAEVSFRIKGSFSEYSSFIALDDISLSSNAQCSDTPDDQFECMNGTKIDSIRICNLVNDCLLGEDEVDCGTCDFETGMCGWINTYKLNNQLWIRKSADNRTYPSGPIVDGQSKANGYYLIIHKNNIGYDKRAQLESSVDQLHRFKRSPNTCRMHFNYYISGQDATLRVVVKEGPSSLNYVWRAIGPKIGGHSWQNATVDIGEHRAPFSVEFEGDIRSLAQLVAIDGITFDSCGPVKGTTGVCSIGQIKCPMDSVCMNGFSLCDGIDDCGSLWDESYSLCSQLTLPSCTFDLNTICPDMFAIESDKGSKSKWFLVNTALFDNLGRKTGPANDHTFRLMDKGVYLALNGSLADQNTKSRLITAWLQSTGQMCAIRLFYYMYGTDTQMGSLRIYGRTHSQTITNPQPIFKKGNLGQQWFRAILAINSSVPFQFVIEGQVGTGSEADIAIDDVSFSSGCARFQAPSSSTHLTTTSLRPSSSSPNPLNTTTSQTTQKGTTVGKQISVGPISGTTQHSLTSVSSKATKSTASTQKSTKNSLHSTDRPHNIGNGEKADPKGIGPYEMAASISVPILVVIALIIGFVFYRRYQNHKSEDSIPLNPTIINMIERNS